MSTTARIAWMAMGALLTAGTARSQTPLGTAFTYQGRLVDGASPATGAYDFQLLLFPAASGGAQVGPTVTLEDVTVVDGRFTVAPDFGAVFVGSKRFLEVGVRPGASTGAFTILAPRQELTPGPNAMFSQAVPWSGVASKPAGFADDLDNDLLAGLSCASGQVAKLNGAAWVCSADADSGGDITGVAAGTGLTGGGATGDVALAVDSAAVQSRVTGTCAAGSSIRTVNQDGSVVCQPDASPGAWGLTGNAGTSPGTQFIGTTDAQPIELRAGGQRALRLESLTVDSESSVNVLAGDPVNTIAADVTGATIAGGGRVAGGTPVPNEIRDNFGTIGGGSGNSTDGQHATVAGGDSNRAASTQATVGGGGLNRALGGGSVVSGGQTNIASGATAAIGGGALNTASASFATVAGGFSNTASGFLSTVPGGSANTAGGDNSLAAGRRAKVRDAAQSGSSGGDRGAFVWADSTDADFTSTGPNQFLIRAGGGVGINTAAPTSALQVNGTATVTGLRLPTGASSGFVLTSDGSGNGTWQAAAGDISAVSAGTGLTGGGTSGAVSLAVDPAAVQTRIAETCAPGSAIRTVSQNGTVVCQPDGSPGAWSLGGNAGINPTTQFIGTTDAQPLELRARGQRALRLESLTVSGQEGLNVVAGHPVNTVAPGVIAATIAGGGGLAGTSPLTNQVTANFGTVGGGISNLAGNAATVAGGANNRASGVGSTTAGGMQGTASGEASAVPGGFLNTAGGDHSLAAGRRAKVRDATQAGVAGGDRGSFVWADTTDVDFVSTGPNQFLVRAGGGVGINTAAPTSALQVNGTATVNGFRLPTGAAASLVLTSDAIGGGTWQAVSLAGEVTGNQGATVVSNAVSTTTPNSIVRRDVLSGFSAGSITLGGSLNLPATALGAGTIRLGNQLFLHAQGTDNTFMGANAGNLAITGNSNTGVGPRALGSLTSGIHNAAFGVDALAANTSGRSNTAVGSHALSANTNLLGNTAVGSNALQSATGASNNTAIGTSALSSVSGGEFNTAIGATAGSTLTGANNILYIHTSGTPSFESNTIRIGNAQQTATFINGIDGQTSASGVAVLISPQHKLGTTTSSRRFKQDIVDMGDESSVLERLRPVAFLYRPEYDETRTRQYGLIAEEVAEVAPELVVFDKDGRPETVRYHFVNAMLLNEVQKQAARIRELERRLDALSR